MDHPIIVRKLDRATVLGEFKMVGSTDPDILQATRSRLLGPSKAATMYSWIMIVAGLAIGLTIIGLFVTIVLLPLGIWGLGRAQANIRTIEGVFGELTHGGLAKA